MTLAAYLVGAIALLAALYAAVRQSHESEDEERQIDLQHRLDERRAQNRKRARNGTT